MLGGPGTWAGDCTRGGGGGSAGGCGCLCGTFSWRVGVLEYRVGWTGWKVVFRERFSFSWYQEVSRGEVFVTSLWSAGDKVWVLRVRVDIMPMQ